MNIHQNARLTPLGRERMVRAIVEGGHSSTLFTRSHGSSLRLAAQFAQVDLLAEAPRI
jgi:hypothetical protein